MRLQEFDIILSYKAPKRGWWPIWLPLLRWFDRLLLNFNKKWYPSGDCQWNHVRMYVLYHGAPCVVEATFPTARITFFEDWMVDPAYAKVYRLTVPILKPKEAMEEIKRLQGKLYDIGQLLAMQFKWRRLDWGKLNMVCSVLVRHVSQILTGKDFGACPKLQETPPAFFANRPDILREVTE